MQFSSRVNMVYEHWLLVAKIEECLHVSDSDLYPRDATTQGYTGESERQVSTNVIAFRGLVLVKRQYW